MNPKVFHLLGLARRAGRIVSGEEKVVSAIRKQQVYVVFLAIDAGHNTKKKVLDKAKFYGVSIFSEDTREELGRAIGVETRVVIGVTDRGFAKEIMKQMTVT